MFDKSINQVQLIGNIGKNLETRTTRNGKDVVNFNLATTRSWKNKDSGERTEDTQWHRITVFGGLAKLANQYLVKSAKVYISGRIQNDRFTPADGIERSTTSIIVSEIQLLSKMDKDNRVSQPQNNEQPQSNNQPHSSNTSWGDKPIQSEPSIEHNTIDFEDDAPF